MSAELSRTVRIDTLGARPRELRVVAGEAERTALAERFGLAGIEQLQADVSLRREGDTIIASGRLHADVRQTCVVTDAPLPALVDAPFTLLFRPQPTEIGDEVELDEGELDVIFYDEALIDIGEAVAETLSLSLDPFPRAPEAEAVLREAGVLTEEEAKPAGALAGLKDLLAGSAGGEKLR